MDVMPITSYHLDEAAKYLGTSIIDYEPGTRQILVKSNLSYLDHLCLGSLNRDVNPAWVEEMKQVMQKKITSKERIQIIACIDIRDISIAINDPSYKFQAIILDAQHRWSSLQSIKQEYPNIQYDFWIEAYVISSEAEYIQLLSDVNNRHVFDKNEIDKIDTRTKFITAFSNLTKGCENRRCVQGTKKHGMLKNKEVIDALRNHSISDIEKMIKLSAISYRSQWENLKNAKLEKSALGATIIQTGLYNLIEWETGKWIRGMLSLDNMIDIV
jgi:hypothetical protein